MKTIHEVLQGLRDVSLDERDKGNHFESLTKRWLEISPEYADIFEKVWTYPEWAAENDLPKTDVGIDLVAREVATGDLCAIQCKFYDPGTSIDKRHIDSFFTALSKKYFSTGIIFSTSTKWSKHAEEALAETTKPVVRVGLHDLEDSGVDWDKFSLKNPGKLELRSKKTPYKHQELATNDVLTGFSTQNRGKLIMACGTGKTFTSLKIAEAMVPDGGTMLFLVPSIALLSQSLKEWKQEAERPITAYAVCSDAKVGKSKDDEDIQVTDLAYPATTNAKKLFAHFKNSKHTKEGFTVIFSTYQSIDVISKAQALGVPEFDLIVCDEAHRTTGVKLAEADESSFIRVHDNKFVGAKKRLYMTATPRIYAEQSKQKALEADATLASMDDDSYYGEEFHRLNFGKAVAQGLLSDYKVLVLAVSEDHVSRQLQKLLTKDGELNLDDATKIVGCYNGLLKRSSNPEDFLVDTSPMRSAVAFSRSIKDSKRLASLFEMVTAELNKSKLYGQTLTAEADHVDGTYNMESRLEKLDWLKEKTTDTVRILSNARCLSEGVDVPALDAVLFLNPRDSQVDVVQSVGRVMRKVPGKQYGYVILPITVPAGKTAEEALADNSKYKVVWQVLQALRSHDERFDAMINKIDLNGDADERLRVIGVGDGISDEDNGETKSQDTKLTLDFPLGEWRDAILAKIVQRVGQRTYWEGWAEGVAKIATSNIQRITELVNGSDLKLREEFESFVRGLQDNINPSLTDYEAIEMLSQHLITKPVFDALFEGYSFSKNNPVSIVMQNMLDALESVNLSADGDQLDKFYDDVRLRVSGITDGGAKQRIVKELYERFFKLAFSATSDRLGIVYTPNEIVDFLLRSADHVLTKSFGVRLEDQNVHVLDPFTGTGTFIVRLLQTGLISPENLEHKFRHELHANEIVLLAYYVAAINIEETFHSITQGAYKPFGGIVLTDTFQMFEDGDKDELAGMEVFPENNNRVKAQKTRDIRVVVGNPPYSVGQMNANENNQNAHYPSLDRRIADSYVASGDMQSASKLYDSYIRAIRWASDRVGDEGVISFVVNSGFIDGSTTAGLRKSLLEEFSEVYVYNLRGNSRLTGSEGANEGGNVFDIRIGVAMLILSKTKQSGPNKGRVFYYESDDNLTKAAKLEVLENQVAVSGVPWKEITPDAFGDWLNQRSKEFDDFVPLGLKGKKSSNLPGIFDSYSLGLQTGRDSWAVNFSKDSVLNNMKSMIATYNLQVEKFAEAPQGSLLEKVIDADPKKISWNRKSKNDVAKGKKYEFNPNYVVDVAYRPFTRQKVYFSKELNSEVFQLKRLFPEGSTNEGICVLGSPFGVLMVDAVPDINFFGFGGQFFPKAVFQAEEIKAETLFDVEREGLDEASSISLGAIDLFRATYGKQVTGLDIYNYVYGILHSKEYRSKFSADLQKGIPKIPLVRSFEAFRDAGSLLGDLHLRYESVEAFPLKRVSQGEIKTDVTKMKFLKTKTGIDKSVLIVNDSLRLEGIPPEVHEHKLGVRTALDWIVDRYQIKVDKDSGIVNDPNFWGIEQGAPTYIIDLVARVVRVSIETHKIVEGLPSLDLLPKKTDSPSA